MPQTATTARKPRHDITRLAIFGGPLDFGRRRPQQHDAHVVARNWAVVTQAEG